VLIEVPVVDAVGPGTLDHCHWGRGQLTRGVSGLIS
jgi:hypothetical protein